GQQTVKIFAAVQQKLSRRIVVVCLVRVEGLHALLVRFAPNWRKGEPIKHPETVSDRHRQILNEDAGGTPAWLSRATRNHSVCCSSRHSERELSRSAPSRQDRPSASAW